MRRRALATLGLLTFIAVLPLGLVMSVGGPYIPNINFGDVSDTLRGSYLPLTSVVRTIAFVCWSLWAYLVIVVILRATGTFLVRQDLRAGAALLGMSDTLTPRALRRLVDVVLGIGLLATTVNAAYAVPDVSTPAAYIAQGIVVSHQSESVPENCWKTYVVGAGDSLWEIAEDELGSGYRWREIWELNRGRSFSDGRQLHNPRLIRPGWVLQLPISEKPDLAEQPPTPVETRPPNPTPAASPDYRRTTREIEHSKEPVTEQQPVIEIPSGGVVAASFASGILAAQALSAIRRRRSRRALAEPESPEDRPLVTDLRRRAQAPFAGHIEAAALEIAGIWQRVHSSLPRIIAAVEEPERGVFLLAGSFGDGRTTLPPSSSRISFREESEWIRVEVRRPFPPKMVRAETPLETGLLVPLGAAGKNVAVHMGLIGLGGLSVDGEQRASLVSQALIACAADASSDDLEIYLLGELDELDPCRELNHVRAVASWRDAPELINRIQAELLARARALMKEGVDDFWGFLGIRVDERMPAMVIVSSKPPVPFMGVVEAIASQMPSLGGAFISLGWAPLHRAFGVRADAKIVMETSLDGIPDKLRPFLLSPPEIQQAIDVINEARPPGWDSEVNRPEASVSEDPDANPLKVDTIPEEPTEPAPPETAVVPPLSRLAVEEESPALSLEIPGSPKKPQIEVRTFGNFSVAKDGRVVEKSFRASSRELLAYLIANPEGVVKDRIIEALWPNLDSESASTEVDRALYYLRQRTGSGRNDHVERIRDLYRLDFQYWWTDASAFESLLTRAGTLAAEQALEETSAALDLYKGPFCDDCYYSWLEPVRDRYRTMFVKASARLANLMTEYDQSDDAIAVLDRAIEVEPVNEDLYRRALSIEGRIGRRKAVVKRFNKLQAVLQDELDVDPDEETSALFRQIMREIEQSRKALQN